MKVVMTCLFTKKHNKKPLQKNPMHQNDLCLSLLLVSQTEERRIECSREREESLSGSLFQILISSETAHDFSQKSTKKKKKQLSLQRRSLSKNESAYNELDVLAKTEAGTQLHIRGDSSCRIPAHASAPPTSRDNLPFNNQILQNTELSLCTV